MTNPTKQKYRVYLYKNDEAFEKGLSFSDYGNVTSVEPRLGNTIEICYGGGNKTYIPNTYIIHVIKQEDEDEQQES